MSLFNTANTTNQNEGDEKKPGTIKDFIKDPNIKVTIDVTHDAKLFLGGCMITSFIFCMFAKANKPYIIVTNGGNNK